MRSGVSFCALILTLSCCGCGQAGPANTDGSAAPPVAPVAPAPIPAEKGSAAVTPPAQAAPPAPPRPADAPAVAVAVNPPKPLDKMYDISQASAKALKIEVQFARQAERFGAAAQLQYWIYRKTKEGGYDLACYLAQDGQLDAAFYYLQEAALWEGVDIEDAKEEAALKTLHNDARWNGVETYLNACEAWWTKQPILEVNCIVPEGYKNDRPIPVVLGLHGYGTNAHEYFPTDEYQEFADMLQVAFVSVSGTEPLGKHRFRWSEDRKRDEAHILKGLESLKAKVTPMKGKILLMGFSQGAEMSFEIAAGNPEQFCGAFVLSPGTTHKERDFNALSKDPMMKDRRFLFCYNEFEHPNTIASAKRDYQWASAAKAGVEIKVAPGIRKHTYPPDFYNLLAPRLAKLLTLEEK